MTHLWIKIKIGCYVTDVFIDSHGRTSADSWLNHPTGEYSSNRPVSYARLTPAQHDLGGSDWRQGEQ